MLSNFTWHRSFENFQLNLDYQPLSMIFITVSLIDWGILYSFSYHLGYTIKMTMFDNIFYIYGKINLQTSPQFPVSLTILVCTFFFLKLDPSERTIEKQNEIINVRGSRVLAKCTNLIPAHILLNHQQRRRFRRKIESSIKTKVTAACLRLSLFHFPCRPRTLEARGKMCRTRRIRQTAVSQPPAASLARLRNIQPSRWLSSGCCCRLCSNVLSRARSVSLFISAQVTSFGFISPNPYTFAVLGCYPLAGRSAVSTGRTRVARVRCGDSRAMPNCNMHRSSIARASPATGQRCIYLSGLALPWHKLAAEPLRSPVAAAPWVLANRRVRAVDF